MMDEQEDVLGNRSILKRTIRSGEADSRPSRNCIATVSYKLYLVETSSGRSRLVDDVSNERFIIGENDILSAIDICIQLMNRGEESLIDCEARHCYGTLGCPEKQIPPIESEENSYRMNIELNLHQWKFPEEISTFSIDERIFWGEKKRQNGNFAYRRQDLSIALQCYRNAAKYFDLEENPLINDQDENSSNFLERFIQVENNLAQVFLLTQQYDQCLETLEKIFKHQPNNVKALFRQGKAFFQLGKFDETLKPLKILLELDNDEIDKEKVKEMFKICQMKLAKYQKNEREIYQRMFQSNKIEVKKTNSSKMFVRIFIGLVLAIFFSFVFQKSL